MDTVSLENRVLEEGQSAELAACFQILREATADDVDKYPEKTCRELARAVVCRTYAPAVHELCHLVAAAAAVDDMGRFENLFWDSGPARARNFHAWFLDRELVSDNIEVERAQVTLHFTDKPFAVTYGRMPFLSALLEFLMTALGYTDLDEALAPLCDDFPDAAAVSDTANGLSRRLYGFLNEHLPPVQEQRRHRGFLGFVAERADGEAAGQAITDDAVLAYWLENSAEDEAADGDASATDARTYRGVFKTAVRLLHILRRAEDKHGMAVALPIGIDREAGEVDPADVEAAMAEIDEDCEPLAQLEDTAAAGVKIVNKREADTLRQALHGEAASAALTRSVLRNAVFGDAQARLIQALRKSGGGQDMPSRIDAEPETGYDERLAAFADLSTHLDRMTLIAFHVLYRARHRDAVGAALAAAPDIDLGALAQTSADDDSNVVSLQAERAMQAFFNSEGSETPLGALIENAAKAAKGIARQGFSEAAWQDARVVDAFAGSVTALTAIRRELTKLLETHAIGIDWAALLNEDTPRFREQFTRLYGG